MARPKIHDPLSGVKVCRSCRRPLALDKYHKSKSGGLGVAARCNECLEAIRANMILDGLTLACRKCKRIFPVAVFPPSHSNADGTSRTCNECRPSTAPGLPSLKKRLSKLKTQAKQRGIPVTLTQGQYDDLVRCGRCRYCQGDLPAHGHGIDRIDCDIAYTYDNCAPCCMICNRVKSDIFSYDEMLEIGATIARLNRARAESGMPKRSSAFPCRKGTPRNLSKIRQCQMAGAGSE